MIFVLLLVILVLTGLLLYYIDKSRDQAKKIIEYRKLAFNWHMYLNNKKHSEDFELWGKEFRD